MRIEVPQFARTGIDLTSRHIVHPYLTRGKAHEDREIAHTRALSLMEAMQNNHFVLKTLREMFVYTDPILQTEIAKGLVLPNPIVMPAGFDKDVLIPDFLGNGLGFGAVTVGTVTKIPYEGNPRRDDEENSTPRIFDLPSSDGLINRMGFPGNGSDEAKERLRKNNPNKRLYKLFISIGASKPSFERGTEIQDFVDVAKQLALYGDGQEQNISSPNTKGVLGLGQRYQDLAQALNQEVYIPYSMQLGGKGLVVLAKLSPDLQDSDRQKIIQIGTDNGVKIFVLGNTSIDTDIRTNLDANDVHRKEAGGISGRPIKQKTLENSHRAYIDSGGETPIILTGGIQNAQDAWNALTYGGASAFGTYSAFVRPNTFTPNFTYYILRNLAKAMRKIGMTSMDDFKQYRGKEIPYPLAA